MKPKSQLCLSLFPGVDLLGRAFEASGFCVVRGPDLITGGDVRTFRGIPDRFDGVFGGSPCQGFSGANRHRGNPDHHSVKRSVEMLREFLRIVDECQPRWFLLENVPSVPNVIAQGFAVQRVAISDNECGGVQNRMRHLQFGHRDGYRIRPKRVSVNARREPESAALAKCGVSYPDHCRKQGVEPPIVLPGWTKSAKIRAVGNGVPYAIGKTISEAIAAAGPPLLSDCPCGCGRELTGRKKAATTTCRKRLQLKRESAGVKPISYGP